MDFEQSLIEPNVKNIINNKLINCYNFKKKYYNSIYNISLFIFFLLILGVILAFKYKGKMSPKEIQNQNINKHNYILSTIKNYQNDKKNNDLITNLPI